MTTARISRRDVLKAAVTGAGVATVPRVLQAQPASIKVGVVSPVTGAMAEVGGDCRLGAQMAADAINAAGGIASMGGARLELLLADSQRSSTSPAPRPTAWWAPAPRCSRAVFTRRTWPPSARWPSSVECRT
jgi:branched-chain amino acid transport system substrate-binding protein